MFAERVERVRSRMETLGVDVLLLSVGPELPYLTGYEAMPLERLTMFVLEADGPGMLLIPELEAPRVHERPDVFDLVPWGETEDPVAVVADRIAGAPVAAIGDRTWARFLVDLHHACPSTEFRRATPVVGPVREVKDPAEIRALRAAGAAADRVARQLQGGEIPLRGRTEAEVSADLGRRLIAEGHHRVNFALVAAGANASSPHHEPGDHVIEEGEAVFCDFGGTMRGPGGVGYCSDMTRVVGVGSVPDDLRRAYGSLRAAQAAAVASATVGATCDSVDRVARQALADDGWGEWFIHRTGHGIGIEEHEDPYIVEGNTAPLAPGNAFSVEPGVYLPGEWGIRLEDIVIATDGGPVACNEASHDLVVVDA
ncbi:MAG: Xaa-Pro peptidase family protein [Acidimicrobiales bacterium]|nr:Xaa-Pro peptidase family protein [Acidimicrobiales bacterium]